MENDNISAAALTKGVSKDGFVKLLGDIQIAVIDEGVNELNNCSSMIEAVRQHDVNGNSAEWITNFEKQLEESSQIIRDNFKEIETIFNRMFVDWEEYKKEHVNDENELVDTKMEEVNVKEEEQVKEEKEPEENNSNVVVDLPKVGETKEVNEKGTNKTSEVAEGDKNE